MVLNCGIGEDSWESLGLQGDSISPFWRRSALGVHWKDWCWSWNSNTLATWCKDLTHLKRPWCWERLRAGGEGDDRGWDGWMGSLTQWTFVWVDSRFAMAPRRLAHFILARRTVDADEYPSWAFSDMNISRRKGTLLQWGGELVSPRNCRLSLAFSTDLLGNMPLP